MSIGVDSITGVAAHTNGRSSGNHTSNIVEKLFGLEMQLEFWLMLCGVRAEETERGVLCRVREQTSY